MYNRKSHHFKILDNESKRQNFINGKNGRKIFNIEEIKKIIGWHSQSVLFCEQHLAYIFNEFKQLLATPIRVCVWVSALVCINDAVLNCNERVKIL